MNIPEIEEARESCIKFRGNKNPADDEIVELILDQKGLYPVNSIERAGELFKERGCRVECACTGRCHELVPYTELDDMCNHHYLMVENAIRNELYRRNKVTKVES